MNRDPSISTKSNPSGPFRLAQKFSLIREQRFRMVEPLVPKDGLVPSEVQARQNSNKEYYSSIPQCIFQHLAMNNLTK